MKRLTILTLCTAATLTAGCAAAIEHARYQPDVITRAPLYRVGDEPLEIGGPQSAVLIRQAQTAHTMPGPQGQPPVLEPPPIGISIRSSRTVTCERPSVRVTGGGNRLER